MPIRIEVEPTRGGLERAIWKLNTAINQNRIAKTYFEQQSYTPPSVFRHEKKQRQLYFRRQRRKRGGAQ